MEHQHEFPSSGPSVQIPLQGKGHKKDHEVDPLKNPNNEAEQSTEPSSACKMFKSSNYSSRILTNFHDLWTTGNFTDVRIQCADSIITSSDDPLPAADSDSGSGGGGGQQMFNAHRAILASSSSYFRAMFTVGLSESENCNNDSASSTTNAIRLQNISSSTFKLILEFIYTGQIFLTASNVQEVLVAADMLELTEVIESCTDFIKSQLHPTNAIGIFRFAETISCTSLAKSAKSYIYRQFPLIIQEEEWTLTPKEILLPFLESEELVVDSEVEVLNGALSWLLYDIPFRKPLVFQILRPVRLALIATRVLDQIIYEISDCSIQLALKSLQKDLALKRGSLVSLICQPRKSAKKHIYVIGGSHKEVGSGWKQISESTLDSVLIFDTFKKSWSSASPMEIERILPGVATIDSLIYVVGGEQESQILAEAEVYCPQEDNWVRISPMIIPRCAFGFCAWENSLENMHSYLFAFGGWVGEDIGGTIERYDPQIDEWTLVGEMSEPRFSMGCFSYGGLIYLLGGCTHTQRHLRNLASYNPITQEWTQLSPMRVSRSQMGIAVLGQHLYVVGGSSRHSEVLCSVERYSFEEDKWEEMCPLTEGRANPSCQAVDGRIYCIGGDQSHDNNFFRAQVTLSSVEVYDPISDSWEVLECGLGESRSEAGSVVV